MANVSGEIKGDKLILTIDIGSKARMAAPLSSTKKSKLLASTNGFTVFEDVKVSLNVTFPNPEYVKEK